jgi:stress response protein YsnF
MEHQTLVAVFDRPGDARAALEALLSNGFSRGEARLGTADELETQSSTRESTTQQMSLPEKIAHFFGLDDDNTTGTYSEAMRRGSSVVVVDVRSADESERAASILDRFNPIDMDQRESEWESSGWRRPQADNSARARNSEQSTVPVVEERLQVGTRVVQAGGVRIFSRTREIPVEERVALREERATVTRRPADRPVTDADRPFEEKSYEVRETREEPVVGKTARVVEEVVVGKETRQREETVRDKVRKTEVDVQQVAGQQPNQGQPKRQRD